jgi:hypothetical protein
MSGIMRRDRAFQAIQIRNLSDPLVKLPAKLENEDFSNRLWRCQQRTLPAQRLVGCVDLKLDLSSSSVHCLNSSVL